MIQSLSHAERTEYGFEHVAEDLRQCLHFIGEITGSEITSDEVLQNIFSHFCVGK